MAKGPEVLRRLKPSIEAATLVAVDDCGNAFVQHPIHQGKGGQAESIRRRNKNDTDNKNQKADGLIKIFG